MTYSSYLAKFQMLMKGNVHYKEFVFVACGTKNMDLTIA